MWHKNEGEKPSGRPVVVRTTRGKVYIAEFNGANWITDSGLLSDDLVTHWHEIPPFEEAEHGCPTTT